LLPESNVAEIVLLTAAPAKTDWFPEAVREKLKGWVTMNEASVSVLSL